MIQEFWIRSLSKAAWKDFSKHASSWVILACGAVLLMAIDLILPNYIGDYQLCAAIIMICFGALYTTILHQNGLDSAYGRPLSMLHLRSNMLFASLFFIAISLYHPLPQYTNILAFYFPAYTDLVMVLNWLIHGIITYLLVRCMFVGMVVLNDACSVAEAFKKSFAMTDHHFLGLLGLFLYLAFVLALSAMTIVGYVIALPYAMVMKALVFKQLHASLKNK